MQSQPPHPPLEAGYEAYYLTQTLQTKSISFDPATLVGHQICSSRLFVLSAMPQRHSSASSFLLPQGNHTPVLISRPEQGSGSDLLCLSQAASLRAQHQASGDMGMSSCPRVHQDHDPRWVSHCFVIHSSSKGHKNSPAPGGGTWHSLHGGATTKCTEGHVHAPRD